MDDAAYYWALIYAKTSAKEQAEYSAIIYSFEYKGETVYGFTKGLRYYEEIHDRDPFTRSPGPKNDIYNWEDYMPKGAIMRAHIHIHHPATEDGNSTFSRLRDNQDESLFPKFPGLWWYLVNDIGELRGRRGAKTFVGHGAERLTWDNFYESTNMISRPLTTDLYDGTGKMYYTGNDKAQWTFHYLNQLIWGLYVLSTSAVGGTSGEKVVEASATTVEPKKAF